ncbi:MAG TPA: tetratricopeptide repeat protein [Pirellulales bacterium]|nr:tetratricopeptide repeat protein [Pirellulales bacterium]
MADDPCDRQDPSLPLQPAARRPRSVRRVVALGVLAATIFGAALGFRYVNSPQSHFDRALRALSVNDFDRAQYELVRLAGLREYEPHASLISGILLLEERKPEDALEQFDLATDHPDTRVMAFTFAGRILYQQRRYHMAEQALLSAVKFGPGHAEAHRWLGVAYFDVGAMSQANVHLRQAAELAPRDPKPNRALGLIHAGLGDAETAIEHYQEALRRDAAFPGQMAPGDRQAMLLELAQCQVERLRHADALATLEAADDSAGTLALRAACHDALGNRTQGESCLEQALRLEPDHLQSLVIRARFALDANDTSSALECLKRAVERHPLDETAHQLLSQTYHRVGEEQWAQEHMDEAERIRALADDFAALTRRAMEEPGDSRICFQVGLAAERLCLTDAAVNWYLAALSLDARNLAARERLSKLRGATADGRSAPP